MAANQGPYICRNCGNSVTDKVENVGECFSHYIFTDVWNVQDVENLPILGLEASTSLLCRGCGIELGFRCVTSHIFPNLEGLTLLLKLCTMPMATDNSVYVPDEDSD